MFSRNTITAETVKQLYGLACTPFQLRTFQSRWEEYGWEYVPGPNHEYVFNVQVPNHWGLWINPLGKNILQAGLPFCYWETFFESDHPNFESWFRERMIYDEIYETVNTLAQEILPSPLAIWKDIDEDGHQATIWEGEHGLLILQQACFDLISGGLEINFWLESCTAAEFSPETPLIDWLTGRSLQVHDRFGFSIDWNL